MANITKPYNVHFVCRGNTFRSRLAAAYLSSLLDERFSISSSGIAASTSQSGIEKVEPYTKAIAQKYGLTYDIDKRKTQTTTQLLGDADVIVFLNKDVYNDAINKYAFDPRKVLVWNVPDISDVAKQKALAQNTEKALLGLAMPIFTKIRHQCDKLQSYLTHTAWVDVVDAKNEPTGLRLPMAWITDRGLWHRGIHVVAQTIDGKYIVGKRTNNIVFAPGMLEISLGGGVDSGEHPLKAAARETHEELGIRMPEKHFRPLFMYKQVGYHPHYHKQTKCHLYVYSIKLPVHSSDLRPQPEEVAELRALNRRQVKRLLYARRMRNFGHLKWSYKLYNKAVAYSSLPL